MTTNAHKRARLSWSASLAALLPHNVYEGVMVLGVLCGMGYYMVSKDSWLLATFLGMLAGARMAPGLRPQAAMASPALPPEVP